MVQRLLDWEIHSARGHTRSDEQISFTNEIGKFGAKPYYTRIIHSLRILQFLFCLALTAVRDEHTCTYTTRDYTIHITHLYKYVLHTLHT